MHWAVKYIGMKYEEGGRGPVSFDCWGLLRAVYSEQFNIELPLLPGISVTSVRAKNRAMQLAIRDEWISSGPFDGAAVAMSQDTVFHHVGVYFSADGGKVLHAWKGQNVIASSFQDLGFKGIRKINFYRHSKWPT